MLKSIRNTIIVTIFLAVVILAIFSLHCYNSIPSEELYKDYISKEDPLVVSLMERVVRNDELRLPYINIKNIDNDRLLKYIFAGLNEQDYTIKNIDPTKIVCEIGGIQFTSTTTCKIKKINNEVFNYYQTYLFNLKQELQFNDFKYQGWTCKNSENKYYCIEDETYKPTYASKSYIDSAYIYDNKIVVYEYYMIYKLEGFIKDPTEEEIKNEGVLYKHTFIRNPDIQENEVHELNYYLEESIIIKD